VADGAEKPLGDQQQNAIAPRPARWFPAAVVLVLAALVAGVFHPVWNHDFIDFDTLPQVVHNKYIREVTLANLKHIFTSRCIQSYYPVRTLTFLVDYQIWGRHAGGFKLTNVVIHLTNVLLALWLVLRLFGERAGPSHPFLSRRDISAAAIAAAALAVHPVVVEPVAWIPGREELLMTLGALATIHFHVTARRFGRAGRNGRAWVCHAAAAISCAAACLSNAVAAVIPMLAVLTDVLAMRERRPLKVLAGTAFLWGIALATIIAKKWGIDPGIATVDQMSLSGRALIATNAYWLQLANIVWPKDLALYYDWLRPSGLLDGEVLLGLVAALATAAALWAFRRQPLVVFGVAWFVVALSPSLQLIPHHIHRADRFLYLPIMGLAVAIAAALALLASRIRKPAAVAGLGLLGLSLVVALAARSVLQIRTWRDSFTVWRQCIHVDPGNARAYDVLAENFVRSGKIPEALANFETALKLRPNAIEILADFARELAIAEGTLGDRSRAVELAQRAFVLSAGKCSERRATFALALGARAHELYQEEEFAQAIVNYERSIEIDPNYFLANLNLAALLVTCPDEKLRDPGRAARLAEWAIRTAGEQLDSNAFVILATAYAQQGRFEFAATSTEKAIVMAGKSGNRELAAALTEQLRYYEGLARSKSSP